MAWNLVKSTPARFMIGLSILALPQLALLLWLHHQTAEHGPALLSVYDGLYVARGASFFAIAVFVELLFRLSEILEKRMPPSGGIS